MKILMAQDTFLPVLGGAEIHVSELVKSLMRRGYQVSVLTSTPGQATEENIQVHRLPQLQGGGRKALIRLPLVSLQVVRLVLSHDLVHCHYSFFLSAILVSICRIINKPVIVSLHGLGTLDSSVRNSMLRKLYRALVLNFADRVIATSTEIADVARRYDRHGKRTVLLPNGVKTNFFRCESRSVTREGRPFQILAVRRLVPKNGIQYLLEALPLLISSLGEPVKARIVGDGRLGPYLRDLTRDLGIEEHVWFIGPVANEDVLEHFCWSDVVVFPSSAESTSIAALEAMSCGRPIVASSVGAFPEMIGINERGFLVNLFDRDWSDYEAPLTLPADRIARLSSALELIARDHEVGSRLGHRAQEYVRQHHDWSVISLKVRELYRELMGRN